jgi:hypothetical protein
MPKLETNNREFRKEADRLANLVLNISTLEPAYQKLVAEVVLLRLFGLVETTLQSVTVKLLCGAKYLDGTTASVATNAKSANGAISNMKKYGRSIYHNDLRWTKASEIKKNVRFLVSTTEHFVHVIDRNGALISEMRKVRNRIAHNNSASRRNFRPVVRHHYGADVNSVTPGSLLLSNRFTPPILEQYVAKSKILIKEVHQGFMSARLQNVEMPV